MKQVQVKKTETTKEGVFERKIWIGEDVWKRIVADPTPLRNVKYELLGDDTKPEPKGKDLMADKVSTKGAVHAEIENNTTGSAGYTAPDYGNYTDAELREACKNADIKFSNVEGRVKLITKLRTNDSNTNK